MDRHNPHHNVEYCQNEQRRDVTSAPAQSQPWPEVAFLRLQCVGPDRSLPRQESQSSVVSDDGDDEEGRPADGSEFGSVHPEGQESHSEATSDLERQTSPPHEADIPLTRIYLTAQPTQPSLPLNERKPKLAYKRSGITLDLFQISDKKFESISPPPYQNLAKEIVDVSERDDRDKNVVPDDDDMEEKKEEDICEEDCHIHTKTAAPHFVNSDWDFMNNAIAKASGISGPFIPPFSERKQEIFDSFASMPPPSERENAIFVTEGSHAQKYDPDKKVGKDGIRPNDVLHGRGEHVNRHLGNKIFHEVKERLQRRYLLAVRRREKTAIAQELVDTMRREYGSRFLAHCPETGKYVEVDNRRVLEKAKQVLREVFTAEQRKVKREKYFRPKKKMFYAQCLADLRNARV